MIAALLAALVAGTSGAAAAQGVGGPVLFRGECTPGGGPAACRVVAVGIATDGGIRSFPCGEGAGDSVRVGIAGRYFAPGTDLDLYLRGAPAGSFTVEAEDPPAAGEGCWARATGRRRGAPGNTYAFIALLPDDPVKLSAIRLPSGVQPDAQAIAVAALAGNPSGGASATQITVRTVRRMRDGAASVLVLDVQAAATHAVLIAEGEGREPEGWKVVWSDIQPPGQPPLVLVDAFDLGADGRPDLLLERVVRGEPSSWTLLRRGDSGWK